MKKSEISRLSSHSQYFRESAHNRSNFRTIFPLVYFDLTKQKMDIKDGTTNLTFKYKLSGATTTDHSIYAVTLYKQDVELKKIDDKIVLRT